MKHIPPNETDQMTKFNEIIRIYAAELDNPVPDSLYRKTLRDILRIVLVSVDVPTPRKAGYRNYGLRLVSGRRTDRARPVRLP